MSKFKVFSSSKHEFTTFLYAVLQFAYFKSGAKKIKPFQLSIR